jgi:hypothetical protein
MISQLVTYLEALGYTVQEQRGIRPFCVVMRGTEPVGFLLDDYSLKLMDDGEDRESLQKILDFVRENQNLTLKGKNEYVLATYLSHQLTTFFDVQNKIPKYTVYITEESGKALSTLYTDREAALRSFVRDTEMVALEQLTRRRSWGKRMEDKALHWLMERQKEEP